MKVKELIKLLQSDDIDPEDEVIMFVEDETCASPVKGYEHGFQANDKEIILV